MIALDSSVAIASFGAWHEHHEQALVALEQHPALPAHAALEAYSTLTRLPSPFRAEPAVVAEFLRRTFPGSRLTLSGDGEDHGALPERLAAAGVSGGASYDGLIALTAQAAGAELLTVDRRALATYQRCGISVRLLT